MAGHNKWSNVKPAQAWVEATKGRFFSRFSQEISGAALQAVIHNEHFDESTDAVTLFANSEFPSEVLDRLES